MSEPVKLMGVPGSPYTRKMLAVLRYRRIQYQLLLGSHRNRPDLPAPKVALLPTFYFPDGKGGQTPMVDSTPLIRKLEADYPGRSILPDDPVMAFLDYLIEDFCDEWLTKAMFHYRWTYDADIAQAREILPRWTVEPTPEENLTAMKKFIGDRQIGRLYVVGSNPATLPVIEGSYHRILAILRTHFEKHPFLLGMRPAAGDFAAYGQLTALTHFDPTPMAITLKDAPRVYAWVDLMDDLSGLDPVPGDWISRNAVPQSLIALFHEVGRVYAPALLANARALQAGAAKVETEIDGKAWVQDPFPYQGRCLMWIREEFAKLNAADQRAVRDLLAGTGCDVLFDPA